MGLPRGQSDVLLPELNCKPRVLRGRDTNRDGEEGGPDDQAA